MKFHFEFDVKKISTPIAHQHKLLLIGSCFTENIGEKLRKQKFQVLENPHGILFNPISVTGALTDYIENKQYGENDLFEYNEAWHSWHHHSKFSGLSAQESLDKINASNNQTHAYIKGADFLMITLGSAWTYTLTPNALNARVGSVAANNHKAPASWFAKKLLTPEETISALDNVLYRSSGINPQLQIIFTISPVRHLREGVIENNRSKAVLIQAVHTLAERKDNVYYFPAYELVIDDLRDYRFYAEDLVHPNYHATQYVWEKFTGACMSDETRNLMEEIASINLAFNHKAFNPHSEQHKKFLRSYYEKTKALQDKYAYLNFKDELQYFAQ